MPNKKTKTSSRNGAGQSEWKEHVVRLHAIEKKLPEHLKTGLDARSIKTAQKASHYIKKAKAVLRKVTVVEVPKPADGSHNKHRALPRLLSTQLVQFRELEMSLPEQHRTGIDVGSLETEGQAAEYIKAMTAKLHNPKSGGRPKK